MNELFSLQGRTALITGGSRGIGRMIAAGFLQHGARVYISSRKADVCDKTAAELSAFGDCISLPADVSSVEGANALAQKYAAREEKLDILINNAGAYWIEPFETHSEKGWDMVVGLNMKAPFFLSQALHVQLRKAAANQPAKIINISSIEGIVVNPAATYSYAASKAGLIHLTRRMALRLIKDNIVVSGIAPGAFATEMNKLACEQPDKVAALIPAKRIGRDEDMAAAAIYLASRAGDYVVGETIVVDGGISLKAITFKD